MKTQELTISLVSPSKPLYEGKITSVILPLYDGLAGILPNHVDMISELGPGKLVMKNEDTTLEYFISGGFVEVLKNKITILANEAYKKQDLKKEKVQEEYKEIYKKPAKGDKEIQEKLEKLTLIRRKLAFLNEK